MDKLDGKVAIVTGASRGIGQAIAKLFAAEGAKVVCAARTLNEGEHILKGSLNATVSEIQKAGGTALAVQTNLADENSCDQLVQTARNAFGPVDVLVNNAVLTYFIHIKDMTIKQWDRSWAVGPRAIFILSKAVLTDMIERRQGAILNISSGAAIGPGCGPYITFPNGNTKYGAQKAAIERFTQGLAEEVYRYGISVTALSPSQIVITAGTLYHKLTTPDKSGVEPPDTMAKAALLLVTQPAEKVTGRVTYSQAILKEFGYITNGKGLGVDERGSGYSQL